MNLIVMYKTPPVANADKFNMATILTTAPKRPTYTFSLKETVNFDAVQNVIFWRFSATICSYFLKKIGDISLEDGDIS